MAESNVTLNPGTGGSDVATMTDGSGYHHQKVVIGLDSGTDPVAVDNSNPVPVSDAGGSITIDDGSGSITVDNAGTFAVQAAQSGTWTVQPGNTANTTAWLVTGTGGTFPATQSGTWNIGTVTTVSAVTAISNALPAGTNNIGDVDVLSVVPGTGATNLGKAIDSAAGSTDTGVAPLAIRDDSLSALTPAEGDWVPLRVNSTGALHVTGAGGGTQYNVDTAAGGTDTGTLALAVRDDALTTLTPADGDYVPMRVTSTGALHVSVTEGGIAGRAEDSAHTTGQDGIVILAVRRDSASSGVDTDGDYATLSVDSSGNLRTTGASGITSYTEDAASAGAESLVLMGAVRRDTAASSSGTDGDYSTVNTDSAGRIWVNASGAAVPITDNSGSITVDGTVSISGTVTVDSELPTAAALADNTANPTVPGVGAFAMVFDGTTWDRAPGTSADGLLVNLGANNDVTVSGTVTANLAAGTNNIGDVDILSIAAGDNNIGNVDIVTMPNVTLAAGTNTNEVVGDAADDAAAAGNPVLIAGVAVETDGTDPTTVSAEGDAAYLRTDRARRLLVSEHHPRSFFTSADYASAQTNTTVQAAPGAGLSLYITDIVISNGATAGNITLLDGSGGTVRFEIYPPINGGVSISLRQPIRLTANTALVITSTTVTTHSINVGGYAAP